MRADLWCVDCWLASGFSDNEVTGPSLLRPIDMMYVHTLHRPVYPTANSNKLPINVVYSLPANAKRNRVGLDKSETM